MAQSSLLCKQLSVSEPNRAPAIDLFSGCLGLNLGTRRLFRTVGCCDVWSASRQLIRARIKDALTEDAVVFKDIREVTAKQLEGVDVKALIAGFPCVDVSSATRLSWAETLGT
jgi:site-specific DNA-cytosine methylase